MGNHNHKGSIWSKNPDGTPLKANRRRGPGTDFAKVATHEGTLDGETPLIVLCYSLGEREISFDAPDGVTYKSYAWDFVVTDDQDPGGFVADVLVNTDGNIQHQLGEQGKCSELRQRLVDSHGSAGSLDSAVG